jgi:hypothetical protein
LADKQPGDATLENTRTATNLNDSANPFDVLHLVEAMERSGITPADSSPDYNLEGELPDLFNTDAPARMLVPQEPLLEDEEFGEFIELSFFMTVSLSTLRGLGRRIFPYICSGARYNHGDDKCILGRSNKEPTPGRCGGVALDDYIPCRRKKFPPIQPYRSRLRYLGHQVDEAEVHWHIRFRFKDIPDLHTEEGRF